MMKGRVQVRLEGEWVTIYKCGHGNSVRVLKNMIKCCEKEKRKDKELGMHHEYRVLAGEADRIEMLEAMP